MARELRRKGESFREIAKKLNVSKSSASLWCQDIILSEKQIRTLLDNEIAGAAKGRMKSLEIHKLERQSRVTKYGYLGSERVGEISKRELFLLGLALYWAEGSKTGRRVIFVNSDPYMICLFIRWTRECFDIPKKDFTCRVQINISHKLNMKKIEKYWSEVTGIPRSQFTKTTLIQSKVKKIYDDHDLYHGVLAIKVRRGTNLSYLVDGGIQHLRKTGSLMIQ